MKQELDVAKSGSRFLQIEANCCSSVVDIYIELRFLLLQVRFPALVDVSLGGETAHE